jgi:hypothetical protein
MDGRGDRKMCKLTCGDNICGVTRQTYLHQNCADRLGLAHTHGHMCCLAGRRSARFSLHSPQSARHLCKSRSEWSVSSEDERHHRSPARPEDGIPWLDRAHHAHPFPLFLIFVPFCSSRRHVRPAMLQNTDVPLDRIVSQESFLRV